jgi:mono/diheme cytochrome c family protein
VSKAAVSALAAGILASGAFSAGQTPEKREVSQVFAESCAACHGAKLQGGQAASLVDDVWIHGGDDASLARSIGTVPSGVRKL